ncbi:MAG: glycosyltransferase family 2 protein [Chitinophagales bacterium]|nr:glycosyltransferase family 2 protein [Chitinophagales bacterium]
MLEIAILAIYIVCIIFIFLFCVTEVALLVFYLRKKQNTKNCSLDSSHEFKEFPFVTVQLPVYNELYVVERLIDAVCSFDYPAARFEIQVLDDSTDETSALITQKVIHYHSNGIAIQHINREDKSGFKAGALQHGLKTARGEFIAIFDADFIPEPDFLKKTIPLFNDVVVGMVQSKWKHINKSYSLLTRVQAFALDAHFNIEQNGRNAAGAFINFNGTAGAWRKTCIEDAGGWSFDTLTEDLDLSYRAQLRGWKFIYNGEVGAPAELPAEMSAVKSQQFRWSKGPAQVSKKILSAMLFSDASLKVKWIAVFHLLNSSINIFIFLTAILSVPLLLFKQQTEYGWAFTVIYVFYSGTLSISLVYLFSQILEEGSVKKGITSFLILFPSFLSLSMGLSLQNALAALRGLTGGKSPFKRTPKYNIVTGKDSWKNKRYHLSGITLLTAVELLMAFYFLYGIYVSVRNSEYQMLLFHFLLFTGFLSTSVYSIKHALFAAKG